VNGMPDRPPGHLALDGLCIHVPTSGSTGWTHLKAAHCFGSSASGSPPWKETNRGNGINGNGRPGVSNHERSNDLLTRATREQAPASKSKPMLNKLGASWSLRGV